MLNTNLLLNSSTQCSRALPVARPAFELHSNARARCRPGPTCPGSLNCQLSPVQPLQLIRSNRWRPRLRRKRNNNKGLRNKADKWTKLDRNTGRNTTTIGSINSNMESMMRSQKAESFKESNQWHPIGELDVIAQKIPRDTNQPSQRPTFIFTETR